MYVCIYISSWYILRHTDIKFADLETLNKVCGCAHWSGSLLFVCTYICHHDLYCDVLILFLRTLETLIEVRGCAYWSGLSLSVCIICQHDIHCDILILETLIEVRGCAYWSRSSLSVCMYVIMIYIATYCYFFIYKVMKYRELLMK